MVDDEDADEQRERLELWILNNADEVRAALVGLQLNPQSYHIGTLKTAQVGMRAIVGAAMRPKIKVDYKRPDQTW